MGKLEIRSSKLETITKCPREENPKQWYSPEKMDS
jgi:hypothetical protein